MYTCIDEPRHDIMVHIMLRGYFEVQLATSRRVQCMSFCSLIYIDDHRCVTMDV